MTEKDTYLEEVIERGDDASGEFKKACDQANTTYSYAQEIGIRNPDNSLNIAGEDIVKISGLKETIDGVGTKIRIYCNKFEHLYQQRQNEEIDGESCKTQCTELWYRMLSDLLAMNVDDLRGGEIGMTATNIIDINHLTGPRGHLFQDTMAQAFFKIIKDTGIAVTAGETAILGNTEKERRLYNIIQQFGINMTELLETKKDTIDDEIRKEVIRILKSGEENSKIVMESIEFNIGGTALGMKPDHEKLAEMKDGDDIVAFFENPVNGIIGPRSNGITRIREDMLKLMGEGWEYKTYEEFIDIIGPEKAAQIPTEVHIVCEGKEMWDIATGQTTVFNPFISQKLLGGFHDKPKAHISSLIHVTGNPLKKIANGIDNEKFTADIDVTNIQLPQIITLLQVAMGISDDEAMNKRNMGIPYAIVCDSQDTASIISQAESHGFNAAKIGKVHAKTDDDAKHHISGIGIGKSTIDFS